MKDPDFAMSKIALDKKEKENVPKVLAKKVKKVKVIAINNINFIRK